MVKAYLGFRWAGGGGASERRAAQVGGKEAGAQSFIINRTLLPTVERVNNAAHAQC